MLRNERISAGIVLLGLIGMSFLGFLLLGYAWSGTASQEPVAMPAAMRQSSVSDASEAHDSPATSHKSPHSAAAEWAYPLSEIRLRSRQPDASFVETNGVRTERYPDGMVILDTHGERKVVAVGDPPHASGATFRPDFSWSLILMVVAALGLLVFFRFKNKHRDADEYIADGQSPWMVVGLGAVLLMGGIFFVRTASYDSARNEQRAQVQVAQLAAREAIAPQASIEELHERLNQPQIPLSETEDLFDTAQNPDGPQEVGTTEKDDAEKEAMVESADSQATPEKSKPKSDDAAKPTWVLNPPKRVGNVSRRVLTAGPYRTRDECYERLEPKIEQVVMKHLLSLAREQADFFSSRVPDLRRLGIDYQTMLKEFCPTDGEYVETLESPSVGDMKNLFVLVAFGPEQDKFLLKRLHTYEREDRMVAVVAGAGFLLAFLGAVFALLKLDTWTRGYYSKRIWIGVPGVLVLLVLFVIAVNS